MALIVVRYLNTYFLPLAIAVLFLCLWRKKDDSAFLWLAVALGVIPLWISFMNLWQTWYYRSFMSAATGAIMGASGPSIGIQYTFMFCRLMLYTLQIGCLVMALRQLGDGCVGLRYFLHFSRRGEYEGEEQ